MEVAPTPIPLVETTIQTSKDFKLSLNNKEFLAKIILTNLIKINLEENENTHKPYSFSWCKSLSLEEFHQLYLIACAVYNSSVTVSHYGSGRVEHFEAVAAQ